MNHVDLFSGIGGFAYAARQVWGDDYHNVCFCEIDPFCQKVIRKNFGEESLIYGDIRTLTRERLIADTFGRGCGEGWLGRGMDKIQDGRAYSKLQTSESSCSIDLLTGGFPCQSFSCAGKRKGTGDDRYLWPEMFRVIRAIHPRWIIAENVRGLISIENGMVFEQVCLDLESEGYEVQAFLVPACAVNAPHRRDRVWIVAYSAQELLNRPRESRSRRRTEYPDADQYVAYSSIENDGRYIGKQEGRQVPESGNRIEPGNATDTSDKGLQGDEQPGTLGERPGTSRPASECPWNESWLEVATRFCRVDDGLPEELHKLETSDRVARLKVLGNAIVPEVVMEIMRAIKAIEG